MITLNIDLSEKYIEKTKKRIFDNIDINENDCWIWKNAKVNGYGRIPIMNKGKKNLVLVHRLSYYLFNGKFPSEKYILHKCPHGSDPSCCNPAHLSVGDQKENCLDRKKEGHEYDRSGIRNKNSKLNDEIVLDIRQKYKDGESCRNLVKKYNTGRTCIQKVISYNSWRHI